MTASIHPDPDLWIRTIFSAQEVGQGGVIHHSIHDVDHYAGRDRFLAAVRKRGFTLVENSDHYVIFCNRNPVRLVTPHATQSLSARAFPVFRRSSIANENATTPP
ncbi:N-(5'-phosphoribosyl)anthranilate isomerase [Marivita sp. S0852]|uniref:N-(5'-phosphoribosyl)anthranilate isomerase n=1 Tax=Marivita sp. S0852 TaxID=3373893 RepID=UPI003981BAD2